MSQHITSVQVDGKPATVVMGWDRPLQGYHLTITMDGRRRDGKCIYSNLEDRELLKAHPDGFGLSPTLDWFAPVLERLHIEVPAEMFEQSYLDCCFNAGNRIVKYDQAGHAETLSQG
jgi:hypothetical protein